VDRPGLDITMSLCTYNNIGHWPLMINDGKNIQQIDTMPGDAAVLLGTKHEHWRPDLKCADDGMVIQVFYHWKFL
jgi:hypothetical protein